jgi:hypothetical protein
MGGSIDLSVGGSSSGGGGSSGTTATGYALRTTPADSDVIHEWRCDEATGATTLVDSAGSSPLALTNTIVPATPNAAGAAGFLADNALVTVGNGNYAVSADTLTGLPPGTAFTIDVWFSPTSVRNSYLFGRQYTTNGGGAPVVSAALGFNAATSSLTVGYFLSIGGTQYGDTGKATVCSHAGIGQWFHYGMTFDGSIVRVYVNGDQVFQEARSGSADFSLSAPWFAGSIRGDTNNASAKVQLARVHKVVRSAAYFRAVYQRGMGLSAPVLTP